MYLDVLLAQRQWTKYQLSKISTIPYATLNDLFNGKTVLMSSKVETLYKLSKALDLTMEELISKSTDVGKHDQSIDPDLFRSNLQHHLKSLGNRAFIKDILNRDLVMTYFQKQWQFETFYTLAMLDYVSRLEGLPVYTRYNELRTKKLSNVIFPSGVLLAAKLENDPSFLDQNLDRSLPEFKRFNIVETEVFNVV